MPKLCSICEDPRLVDIDKSLESLPRHEVSRIYEIPKHRIDNHAQKHIHKRTSAPKDGELGNIAQLKAQVQDILDSTKDDKIRLAALQRLESLHGLELRLHQEQSGSAHLANDHAFQRLAVALDQGLCAKCVGHIDALLEGLLGTAVATARVAPTPGDIPPE